MHPSSVKWSRLDGKLKFIVFFLIFVLVSKIKLTSISFICNIWFNKDDYNQVVGRIYNSKHVILAGWTYLLHFIQHKTCKMAIVKLYTGCMVMLISPTSALGQMLSLLDRREPVRNTCHAVIRCSTKDLSTAKTPSLSEPLCKLNQSSDQDTLKLNHSNKVC